MAESEAERQFPEVIRQALTLLHPSWRKSVLAALEAMQACDPGYLPGLIEGEFFPVAGRLFSAFTIPVDQVRYVLVGEGPYPRAESATGFCFMDGAVTEIWSNEAQGGLSKKVNRATSLRNFIKMLLVADEELDEHHTSGTAMLAISAKARGANSGFIQSLPELQSNLTKQGFLLLNAALVFRRDVAPAVDAKAWRVFLQVIFATLNEQSNNPEGKPVYLVLWGKIAEQLKQVPASAFFPHVQSEHPYNLSFIGNKTMQDFFAPMHLLRQPASIS